MAQSIVDDLFSDPNHVVPAYNFVQERKAVAALASKVEPTAAMFDATTFGGIDDDFKVERLVSVSNMSAVDILKAVKKDASTVDNLVHFATQVSPRQKLPTELLHVEVMRHFLDYRYSVCGKRLASFKTDADGPQRAHMASDSSVSWECGSYSLIVGDDGHLKKCTHVSGDVATLPNGIVISTSWRLTWNWDEFTAALALPPCPPFPLRDFFAANLGPHAISNYVGKPK